MMHQHTIKKVLQRIPDSKQVRDILWLCLLASYIFMGMFSVPFHGDEATQIFMSRDFAYHFVEGDLSKILYQQSPSSQQEQDLRLINGTINKYAIGLSWYFAGFTMQDLNEQWDWGADYTYNIENGHSPTQKLLIVSRISSTLFTIMGLLVIFQIGWLIGERYSAYLAALFYAMNPAILVNGRRAMMEGSLIFSSLLVLLMAIYLGQVNSFGKRWLYSVLLGIASGFAVASKHTNVVTVMAIFIALGIWIFIDSKSIYGVVSRLQQLGILFVSGGISLVVFRGFNPAWWQSPVKAATDVLHLRQNLLQIQADIFDTYPTFSASLRGFWEQVFVGQPMYYEVDGWASALTPQIAEYQGQWWAGIWFPGSGYVLLGLFLVGLVIFLRRWRQPTRWLVILWTIALLGFTLILTPFAWQRYYLPAIPAVLLIAAHGAGTFIKVTLVRLPEADHDNTSTT